MAWLSGWSYRKEITITGQSGAGTNYQVTLDIGDSAGGDFHLEGHCTNFPQDIAVTDNDETTLLDFWIEDITADPLKVWVEVADDLGTNKTIYIYYRKSGATTDSSISDTFLFGDDFEGDLSKWTTNGGQEGTPEVVANPDGSGDVLKIYNNGGNTEVKPNDSIGKPIIVECKLRSDTTSDGGVIGFATGWWANSILEVNPGYPTTSEWGYYDGAWKDTSVGYSINTWYDVRFTHTGSVITVDVDDSQVLTESIATEPTVFNIYSSTSDTLWFDNFRLRKYNSPEPAFSSAGSEETPPVTGNPYWYYQMLKRRN